MCVHDKVRKRRKKRQIDWKNRIKRKKKYDELGKIVIDRWFFVAIHSNKNCFFFFFRSPFKRVLIIYSECVTICLCFASVFSRFYVSHSRNFKKKRRKDLIFFLFIILLPFSDRSEWRNLFLFFVFNENFLCCQIRNWIKFSLFVKNRRKLKLTPKYNLQWARLLMWVCFTTQEVREAVIIKKN